jgi:YVTN family beta-propeller protein
MTKSFFAACAVLILCSSCNSAPKAGDDLTDPTDLTQVGPAAGGGHIVSTRQLIRPAGQSVEYRGRPVDLVLSPDGKTVYVKSSVQLLAIDVETWKIRQELKVPAFHGASMHGIAISADGSRVYMTTARSTILEALVGKEGALTWGRKIALPAGAAKGERYPCGIALLKGNRALVCLSMTNSLAVVDLLAGRMIAEIPTGMAPYDVVASSDGKTAYVSNWGGRRPREGDKTADSGGSDVVVDERGIASTGTVGVIDLAAGKQIKEIPVGLHPADLERSENTLFVANANSDTVSVIDLATLAVTKTLAVRPDAALPFGSASNAVAAMKDKLFVANGGNNAVAMIDPRRDWQIDGFIPTGWYPAALASDGANLFIANAKGIGSRDPADAGKWNSHSYWGSVTKVAIPQKETLAAQTKQVLADALVPQTLKAWEKAKSDAPAVPVPKRVGEASVFEHVVYIIKENRTYDQIFGDMAKGNGDPKLCVFGREATPNHHALAEQFVLLDNFYCNGVLSADGHAWATEGVAVDYLEKSFGAWSRSYPYPGNDAMAFASSGFIWDNVLLHGLSFRNYGEMSVAKRTGRDSWADIYQDYIKKTGKIEFEHRIAIDMLRQYSCPDSPGWNLKIPDQIRADAFLAEFHEFEQKGQWPNLSIIYLPSDHTSGTAPGGPTPAAQVADNDLALGRIVDAISHSKFWPKTCIFVIEDDPQAGFDHVDGHRSICLAISSYTKRGAVVSNFYNQTSVLHTMELMLGIPPMNQMDAMAPVMRECFTAKPDLRPYTALPNNVPLDQLNPAKAALSGHALELAEQSERLPLDLPDRADEDTLNRIVWHSVRGIDAPYPSALAGAHGTGLRKLHLKIDRGAVDDDD